MQILGVFLHTKHYILNRTGSVWHLLSVLSEEWKQKTPLKATETPLSSAFCKLENKILG